jgi:iron complex outermembrane receptor protein
VNLHSSYKAAENIEVFGLVRNLFDRHYYVYGTFFDVNSFPYLNLTDPRTFVPGIPFAVYLGVRGTLPQYPPMLRRQNRQKGSRSLGPALHRLVLLTGAASTSASMPALVSGLAIGLTA